ncbi:MAG TPA: glycosyltransferase family 4 protein [Ilumatobacteraceae bacterium]|jgi:glycosyltransferase involved in cell wall biosynthesis|nr:glycosyltransferase family 4 protein [Ilumatobacteraceae bacterium]
MSNEAAPGATTEPSIEQLAAEMIAVGCRRVHVLAWRDLDDHDAGGSEVHADHFMRRWAAAGLEITHRTSFAQGLPTHADRNGYHVVRKGSRYSVFPRGVARELWSRHEYDALVEIWNGVPWLSPVWCHKPRITFLHHVHGPMWNQLLPRPLAFMGRAVEARLAPPFYRRTLTLTPSDATRDELLHLGFKPSRVVAVNNGVDDVFHPGGERASLPTVVSVGRLAPVKRQDHLIDEAVVAKRRVPGLQLVIVGEGPLKPVLEQRIDEHGAHDWITLAGKLSHEDLLQLYQRSWLVTSASLAEGWGLTLTEAAACGTPAVATDVNGHRSSVVDGATGVLVPLERLGDTIADVLLDDPRRLALADAALTRARTLTWEASARGVLAALHGQVMARAAGRRRPTADA